MNNPTLKIVTSRNKIIDTLLQLPTGNNYINMLKYIIKRLKTLLVYILYKIEWARSIVDQKYGKEQYMKNNFDHLVNNIAFLTLNKFLLHKEHFIGFFTNTSARITLVDSLRSKLQDTLKRIVLQDINGKDGQPTRKNVSWYLHLIYKVRKSAKIADQTESHLLNTKFKHHLKILKYLLYNFLAENINTIKFIPYGIDTIT